MEVMKNMIKPKALVGDVVVVKELDCREAIYNQVVITQAKQVLEDDGHTYWLYRADYLADDDGEPLIDSFDDKEIFKNLSRPELT